MGTNSQQALQAIDQGVDLFKDIREMTSSQSSDNEQARLLETDAKADAREAQRDAVKEARQTHSENEHTRSAEQAAWGASNLKLSGSKSLIRDAKSIQDKQEEDDILYEGQRNADSILRQARNRANLLRINSGSSANRSTLSMGSSIYGPRS